MLSDPDEADNVLGPIFGDGPGGLLKEHLHRLLAVMDAEKAVHGARVYKAGKDRIDELERELEDAQGDVESFRQDAVNALRLVARWARDVDYGAPDGHVDRIRDDLAFIKRELACTRNYFAAQLNRLREKNELLADALLELRKGSAV